MSEILIKNVDIPDDNPLVLMLTSDGLVCEKIGSMFHVADALWKEVPPHGRLIDADAFIKQNEEGFEEPLMQGEDQIGIRVIPMDAVSRAIENAPTVLEAST